MKTGRNANRRLLSALLSRPSDASHIFSLLSKTAAFCALAIASLAGLIFLQGVFAMALPQTPASGKENQKLSGLVGSLNQGDAYDRHRSIIALGASGDKAAVEPLIRALDDEDYFVRSFAARALSALSDPRAVEPIIKALEDEHPLVQNSAAQALGSLKDPKAVDPLIQALSGGNFLVRRSAAMALGEIRDARAVDPLIDALSDGDTFIGSGAAIALIKIGEPALPKLVAGLSDWTAGPKIIEILNDLRWQPASDYETVWFDVARRSGQSLSDNWETVKKVLWKDANGENLKKAQSAVFALVGIGREDVADGLAAILEKKGDVETAIAFTNCGNASLAESGRKWLRDHGAENKSRNAPPVIRWGEMN